MQRRLYIEEAHTALDIFRFTVFLPNLFVKCKTFVEPKKFHFTKIFFNTICFELQIYIFDPKSYSIEILSVALWSQLVVGIARHVVEQDTVEGVVGYCKTGYFSSLLNSVAMNTILTTLVWYSIVKETFFPESKRILIFWYCGRNGFFFGTL